MGAFGTKHTHNHTHIRTYALSLFPFLSLSLYLFFLPLRSISPSFSFSFSLSLFIYFSPPPTLSLTLSLFWEKRFSSYSPMSWNTLLWFVYQRDSGRMIKKEFDICFGIFFPSNMFCNKNWMSVTYAFKYFHARKSEMFSWFAELRLSYFLTFKKIQNYFMILFVFFYFVTWDKYVWSNNNSKSVFNAQHFKSIVFRRWLFLNSLFLPCRAIPCRTLFLSNYFYFYFFKSINFEKA